MWLKLSSGREELVINEDHIKRLLSEGAQEIPDPRVSRESENQEAASTEDNVVSEKEEVVDGSTGNDGRSDQPGQVENLRSKKRKPTV